ncbi:hypothetical protein LX36DRAFT_661566, partial [Colletotrichum falcatum]
SANIHDSCACHNSGSYNWRMTTKACQLYATKNYKWGTASYDAPSGNCVKSNQAEGIAGDQWEEACKEVAKTGYQCADNRGRCSADPDSVRGRC